MATSRPFAYNTGDTINGSIQLGRIAIGVDAMDYSGNIGTEGERWWMGPDEELGYVICVPDPLFLRPVQFGVHTGLGFFRTEAFTDESFLSLVNTIAKSYNVSNFSNVGDAEAWLILSGFPTTYNYNWNLITPSITPTLSLTPSRTPSITPSISLSRTPSITPSISFSQTPSKTTGASPSATPNITPSISITRTPSITPSIWDGLLVEGIDYTMTTHNGYEIPRSSPTNLIFRYSRISTSMDDGYMLMAGDNNYYVSTATNLDGAQIYGNRFISSNTAPSGSVHGIMMGYNQNYDVHHNYVMSYKYGFTHEGGFPDHTSMNNSSGGFYYNTFKNNTYHLIEKGYNGTRIINNTFYTSINLWGYFISVKFSDTGGFTTPYPPAANTKIFNNIFYNDGPYINLFAINLGDENDINGFECDYNVYYYVQRANHEPVFQYQGSLLTWTQWRALGYDEHSVILDPDFIDLDDFIPTSRLDYGTPITGFEYGLSVDHEWVVGEAPTLVAQGSNWQVGARIYAT